MSHCSVKLVERVLGHTLLSVLKESFEHIIQLLIDEAFGGGRNTIDSGLLGKALRFHKQAELVDGDRAVLVHVYSVEHFHEVLLA